MAAESRSKLWCRAPRLRKRGALPWETRGGYLRFRCGQCHAFDTATHPQTNLARCFRCGQNFNSIDLVMAIRRVPFLDAAPYLRLHELRVLGAQQARS
ncbi:MAG: hypothetical protein JXQ29_08225 [Planctomycetes bacterium]|nr:hypothetical protein [Planctomycetota bacterium]